MNRHPYKYTFVKTGLIAGDSYTPDVQIGNDIESFTATSVSALVIDAATGITVSNEQLPLILANIQPALDEAGICNVPTPLSSIAGNGREPHLLDMPVEFPGGSKPVVPLQNISTDKTYDVYVTLHGYRTKK